MKFFINQDIIIYQFKVDSVSNSPVLQIGSAGMIKTLSNLYNRGGFTRPSLEISEGVPSVNVQLPPPSD